MPYGRLPCTSSVAIINSSSALRGSELIDVRGAGELHLFAIKFAFIGLVSSSSPSARLLLWRRLCVLFANGDRF